jgi:hypothetical protein
VRGSEPSRNRQGAEGGAAVAIVPIASCASCEPRPSGSGGRCSGGDRAHRLVCQLRAATVRERRAVQRWRSCPSPPVPVASRDRQGAEGGAAAAIVPIASCASCEPRPSGSGGRCSGGDHAHRLLCQLRAATVRERRAVQRRRSCPSPPVPVASPDRQGAEGGAAVAIVRIASCASCEPQPSGSGGRCSGGDRAHRLLCQLRAPTVRERRAVQRLPE